MSQLPFEIISEVALPKRRGHSYIEGVERKRAREAKETAKENGEQFYCTGLPCRRNHYSKRYTNNGQCLDCTKFHKLKNKGKYNSREYYRKNINKIKAKERKLLL